MTTPRIDLHRHLDGNIRLATVLDLARKNGVALPADSEEELRPFVTVTGRESGLVAFLGKFRWSIAAVRTLEDCWRIAFENVEDALTEGLDAVELRFSPAFMGSAGGLNPSAVSEAVADGVAAGTAAFGVPVGLIGILSRTFGPEACARELDALLGIRPRLVAVDLAGDEAAYPAAMFEAHFRKVRDAGLGVTVHAGEADGPWSVRDAIELLGATRIGHGVRAIEDPDVMDLLARRGTGLECCPTSNVQTSTVTDYTAHPLRDFCERGLRVTINTDDPGISGIDFDHELLVAREKCGLSEAQVASCLANAAALAFPRA